MRALWVGAGIAGLCLMAVGDNVGVPPRPSYLDYPAHQGLHKGSLGAVIVRPDQIGKMFSSEIAKKYIVIEVAVYPENGNSFDVEPFDFSLRVGNRTSHTEIPPVGSAWPGNPAPAPSSPQVTTETGVIVSRETDPYGRPVKTVGTYTGVSVTNGNPPPPPPPNAGPDSAILDQKLRTKALGGGLTRTAVAGYLYFPQSGKKRKSDTVELQYSNRDESVGIPFPK